MASRTELREQKEKTSAALIEAAIQLCAEEGYASLSLRSVARKAGIAPTSFYRHFREIDELGVAVVDQAKTVLEECMSQARQKMLAYSITKRLQSEQSEQILQSIECIVRPFVETFIEYFQQNSHLLCLFFQEYTGSSEAMRRAIEQGINSMAKFLGEDLTRVSKQFPDGFGEISLIAESMITIASHTCVVMTLSKECERITITEQLIKKLNLLLLGASIYPRRMMQRNNNE